MNIIIDIVNLHMITFKDVLAITTALETQEVHQFWGLEFTLRCRKATNP